MAQAAACLNHPVPNNASFPAATGARSSTRAAVQNYMRYLSPSFVVAVLPLCAAYSMFHRSKMASLNLVQKPFTHGKH